MFDNIFNAIEDWMRGLLTGMVDSSLETMVTGVNEQTGEIAAQVGATPSGWNSSIYNMVKNLSDTVIVPIAGIIITMVLCYELITMITEKNNMQEVDTWMFFKYFFKMWVAVYLVSNTWTITMAVFDIGQSVAGSAAGVITGTMNLDISSVVAQMDAEMATMGIGELLLLALESLLASFCMRAISIVITVVLYGRMIEIYLYVSVAPIPFATFSNKEWSQTGMNYFRGLWALAFQAFLMMVCVGIYAVLVSAMTVSSNVHMALFEILAYTVLLCYALMRTGNLSRSIFNAH